MRVIILKPGKYDADGYVQRFRRGFMPNSTVVYLASLTPPELDGARIDVTTVDEYVHADLDYLQLLRGDPRRRTLLALAGVQSHQFQRALDLAAFARANGVESAIIGGPHPMTCDTTELHGRGVSFCLSEAESVWEDILRDALAGELEPVYGGDARWAAKLEPPVLVPPTKRDLQRYAVRMLGIYPARGCPYTCNFCSVIKIAGRQVRSQPVETTIASLKAAKAAGVKSVLFTSDNLNKYSEVRQLLQAMIDEKIELPFFCQCDTQIARQEDLVELMGRAGCFQIFVGVESFSRQVLLAAHKFQNHPDTYGRIIELCRKNRISAHFSNIIGFPSDTRGDVLEHLRHLRELDPDIASFYILTPIPGTDQYEEFLDQGLITVDNLDRLDGTCVTWRHPHFEGEELMDLMLHCYSEFSNTRDVARRVLRHAVSRWSYRTGVDLYTVLGYALLQRSSVKQRVHPMNGGAGRVRLDQVSDYAHLRREYFGVDLVPLPHMLQLSAADEALNRAAKLH
ncbi:MAG TPA: radical SAM protein [Thermoanaerobaculia bacterium]|nr:radical SAM protein [Thermoanaerobaculia bacterium]